MKIFGIHIWVLLIEIKIGMKNNEFKKSNLKPHLGLACRGWGMVKFKCLNWTVSLKTTEKEKERHMGYTRRQSPLNDKTTRLSCDSHNNNSLCLPTLYNHKVFPHTLCHWFSSPHCGVIRSGEDGIRFFEYFLVSYPSPADGLIFLHSFHCLS